MTRVQHQTREFHGRHAGNRWAPVVLLAAIGLSLLASTPAAAAPTALTVQPLLIVSGPEPGLSFNGPRGIALDAAHQEVVLANTDDHLIEIFSLAGDRRARFIHRVQGQGGQWEDGVPQALVVDRAGRILVSDRRAAYVDILDYRGRSVGRVEIPAAARDSAGGPGALALTPDGGLLIADRGLSGRVYRFSPGLEFAGAWGDSGAGPGQLTTISGIAVAAGGEVVVTCTLTQLAVQIFSPTGEYLRGFGVHDIGAGNFSYPSGVTIASDNRIWVTDQLRQIIQVFDLSGQFLQSYGGIGSGPGQFLYPSALASNGTDLVAVAECRGNRFQLLRVQ
jgi:DNA-binding beta-propeller fold protein YncE